MQKPCRSHRRLRLDHLTPLIVRLFPPAFSPRFRRTVHPSRAGSSKRIVRCHSTPTIDPPITYFQRMITRFFNCPSSGRGDKSLTMAVPVIMKVALIAHGVGANREKFISPLFREPLTPTHKRRSRNIWKWKVYDDMARRDLFCKISLKIKCSDSSLRFRGYRFGIFVYGEHFSEIRSICRVSC